MISEPNLPASPPKKSFFKNPLLYSSATIAIAMLFVVGLLLTRWWENRRIEREATEQLAQKQLAQDRAALEQMGGKELAIQSFYASPGAVRRGETVQLCYGVANAKTVKLEPQSNPVWPSQARCVDVTPSKTTTYTLTIEDAAGHTLSQTLEVTVR
jgi:hypothetical protein